MVGGFTGQEDVSLFRVEPNRRQHHGRRQLPLGAREMMNHIFHFGAFEVNEHLGELRKHGVRIRIQEQPFQILALLLHRAGDVVDREEIRKRLWPENTYVDFDNAISSAVRKLREALGDSAENPRFIETFAKRGYRFIAPLAPLPEAPQPKRISIKAIPITAGALLVLGLASWWLWNRPESNPVSPTPLPLTATSGWEGHPTFSPDGNQIAYAEDETGTGNHSHIYVKLIGSGRPMQLTTGPSADYFPEWSPDGRSIAFIRKLDEGNAIYLIPPVGGTERKLVDGHFWGPGRWSPDGRFLAIGDRKSPNDLSSLYRIAVENGEKLHLNTPPDAKTQERSPVFSPDGRTLLFTRCSAIYTCGLYLLDLSADYRPKAAPRLLREESGAIHAAVWTPDGKEVVYVLSNDAILNYHLMRIRVGRATAP